MINCPLDLGFSCAHNYILTRCWDWGKGSGNDQKHYDSFDKELQKTATDKELYWTIENNTDLTF